MNRQWLFRLDVIGAAFSFIGMVLGVVAVTGNILYPWPVAAARIIVNALLALLIAGKIIEYLRYAPSEDNDAIGGIVAGLVISSIVVIVLFVTRHMGVLSTAFLIAFCIMGYVDRLVIGHQGQEQEQEQASTIIVEQEKGN